MIITTQRTVCTSPHFSTRRLERTCTTVFEPCTKITYARNYHLWLLELSIFFKITIDVKKKKKKKEKRYRFRHFRSILNFHNQFPRLRKGKVEEERNYASYFRSFPERGENWFTLVHFVPRPPIISSRLFERFFHLWNGWWTNERTCIALRFRFDRIKNRNEAKAVRDERDKWIMREVAVLDRWSISVTIPSIQFSRTMRREHSRQIVQMFSTVWIC